jgi:HSP20 family molecular chaperone IbpA
MNGTNVGIPALEFFDRVFRSFDRDLSTMCSCSSITFADGSSLYENKFPPMNLGIKPETKDLTFEFALVGYKEKEISVSFDEDYLCLTLSPEDMEDKRTFIKHGIRSSRTEAKYFVPSAKYDVDKSMAELKDGLLSVFIPAKEEIKPKKILIGKKSS